MKILVTGGTGFAGTHLIHELLSRGFTDVHSTTFSMPEGESKLLSDDRYHRLDLTDKEATRELFAKLKPQWIFHLASFAYVGKSFEKAQDLFDNNIRLQLSVLEAMREVAPDARLLSIGSAEEYGVIDPAVKKIDENVELNPVNPYAVSKVTQDLLSNSYVLSYKLDIVRARPFNHIGAGQTGDFAIPAFVKQIVAIERGEQEELHVGNLSAVRDFTNVVDTVRAYVTLMEKGKSGEVYNIGSGEGLKMKEVVDMLCSMAKVKIKIVTDPARLRPLDVPILVADNKKIKSLGWEAKEGIESALRAVFDEWRNK